MLEKHPALLIIRDLRASRSRGGQSGLPGVEERNGVIIPENYIWKRL